MATYLPLSITLLPVSKLTAHKPFEQKDLSVITAEILKIRKPFDYVRKHNAEIFQSLDKDKFSEGVKKVLRDQIEQPDAAPLAMYTAENMMQDFKSLNYSIITIEDEAYIYDGFDWRSLSYTEFKHFMSQYLSKSGLPKSKAESVSTVERYAKQMYFSLYRAVSRKRRTNALINAANCTVEIDRNGNINQRKHDESDFFFYVLPYSYDPIAKATLFRKFLDEVLPGDIQLVVQEFLGTCLIVYFKHEKVLCCVGAGANGKSVLFDVVRYVLGIENVTTYSINSLCDEKSTTRLMIQYKLLNYSSDFSGKIWNNGIFKQLASGEPVEARKLYHDPINMTEYARLAFNSNSMPDSNDTSAGFLRRLLLVEFKRVIPVEKRDPNLANKLCQEAPGILNWMIEGLVRFIKNGLKFSESTTLNTSMQSFQDATDNVKAFMEASSYKPGNAKMRLKDLYDQYKAYCSTNNIKIVESRANFKIKLEGSGYNIESKDKKAEMICLDLTGNVIKPF